MIELRIQSQTIKVCNKAHLHTCQNTQTIWMHVHRNILLRKKMEFNAFKNACRSWFPNKFVDDLIFIHIKIHAYQYYTSNKLTLSIVWPIVGQPRSIVKVRWPRSPKTRSYQCVHVYTVYRWNSLYTCLDSEANVKLLKVKQTERHHQYTVSLDLFILACMWNKPSLCKCHWHQALEPTSTQQKEYSLASRCLCNLVTLTKRHISLCI